jgi:hypothetical protein
MLSRKKLDANRRNARKATGPKSRAGKARSSRNSFRHGLRAVATGNDDDERSAKLSDLLRRDNADEEEYQQAAVIGECQLFLARVRAARAAVIERMRGEGIWRTDVEGTNLAIDDLRALDHYERRALSRRRMAIERLMAIRHLADVRAG